MSAPKSLPRQYSAKHRLFLTADEHYHHSKILQYQGRPFGDVKEMNRELIERHNSVVGEGDHVIHVGDFCFGGRVEFIEIVRRLRGVHYFMDGSHDWAMAKYLLDENKPSDVSERAFFLPKLFEFTYSGEQVVLCHYAMMTWRKSHYGSFHGFGHSHGRLNHPGRARDVGVDTNDFRPYQIEELLGKRITKDR